jgi:hypothetical protein
MSDGPEIEILYEDKAPDEKTTHYLIHKWGAWMCIGITAAAGFFVGFAMAVIVLVESCT